MAQMTSGTALRQARERKGLDLNTVARRLRIRPDILRAIENGDFSGMPPRGYTRNMVNAYARLVGLNPTEIVNMYLDEVRANQLTRSHASSSNGFNMSRGSDRFEKRGSERSREHRRSSYRGSEGEPHRSNARTDYETGESKRSLFTRDLYDDRTPFSRDDYGMMRDEASRERNESRDFQSHHSGYGSNDGRGFSLPSLPFSSMRSGKAQRSRATTSNVGYTRDDYRGNRSRFSDIASRRGIIAIAAIVILVILVIVLAVSVSNRNAQARSQVSTLPVSGIADTTEGESSLSSSAVAAPTSVAVTYAASNNTDVYLEIYTNGAKANETLSAGKTESVSVTGTWTITTWTPANVTVTVDGKQVELKSSSTFGGMYAYTVDFKSYLESWGSSHNQTVDTSGITSTVDSSGNDTLSVTSGPQAQSSSAASSSAAQSKAQGASASAQNGTGSATTTNQSSQSSAANTNTNANGTGGASATGTTTGSSTAR